MDTKQCEVLQRKRKVQAAQTLLRLELTCSFGGLSLRETAVWSQIITPVALLKRL